MKLKIPPYTCQNCQWQDTPTPSTDKQFDLNINPKQQNNPLTTELENLKVVYEEFQDQTQQKLLELEGEIN
jgi:hypothetical protein